MESAVVFGREVFKSHALLDESAVLACVAYVNLNPIRANMPSTPEELSCRSIQKRTHVIKQQNNQPYQIMPFVGNLRKDMPKALTIH
jgi:hypothetical protein